MGAVLGWTNEVSEGPHQPAGQDGETPMLTEEGRAMLEAKARRLGDEVLPELTRAMRDSEEDSRLANEYGLAMAELQRLSGILGRARVIERPSEAPRGEPEVGLGDEVELRLPDGDVDRLRIVHPVEAPLDDQRISAESPLASALLGHRPGEVVEVQAPGAPYRCRLLRWERSSGSWILVAEVVPGRRRAKAVR